MSRFDVLKTTAFCLSLFAVACGGGEPESDTRRAPTYTYQGVGRFNADSGVVRFGKEVPVPSFPKEVPQLSTEERNGFCAIHAEQETDAAVKSEFLTALNGEWRRHYPAFTSAMGNIDGEAFTFETAKLKATRSAPTFFSAQSITAKRFCLSKPLRDVAQYSDYRILELVAQENEGVAVLAIKFGKPEYGFSHPTLYMTEFEYYRYGSTESLRSQSALFTSPKQDESSIPIEVYPFRP